MFFRKWCRWDQKQLKELIPENTTNLIFVKSNQKTKPKQLIDPSTRTNALNAHADVIIGESDIVLFWILSK